MNYKLEKETLIQWSVGLEGQDSAPIRAPSLETFNWAGLLERAETHRIDLLLAHNLLENSGAGGEGFPQSVEEQFVNWLEEGKKFEDLRFSRGVALLTALEIRGVKCVILKGPALALYYPRPELRRYKDFDIFVAEKDLPETKAALSSIGYESWRAEADWWEADSFTHHWPPFWYPADEQLNIEIHGPRHHSGGFLGLIDTTEWLDLAEPAIWREREFLTLPKELSLLYCCTHAHRHQFVLGGPRRLKNAFDLYLLIRAGIDWEKFLSHFRRYRSAQEQILLWWEEALKKRRLHSEENGSPLFDWADLAAHVHYGLSLVNDIFEEIVPEKVLNSTCPKEKKLLDVGLICEAANDTRLFVWNIPLAERYLQHATTPKMELIELGALRYWRQLPKWTSLDDVLHYELWQEICSQAPRIRPI